MGEERRRKDGRNWEMKAGRERKVERKGEEGIKGEEDREKGRRSWDEGEGRKGEKDLRERKIGRKEEEGRKEGRGEGGREKIIEWRDRR